jgi:RimJ/RimL family protein N-acetyltransferase
MQFYPSNAVVPNEKRTDRLLLRPLRASDVEQDYDAVMSSPEMLRRWSQSDWPSDDFTLKQNLDDLERHEHEHTERVAFTFTVVEPHGSRCLGCVYITPLWPPEVQVCPNAGYAANVSFWVRASEVSTDLDQHLLATLLDWLRAEWAFDCLVFPISEDNERQAALFQEAGLERRASFSSPDGQRQWQVFS